MYLNSYDFTGILANRCGMEFFRNEGIVNMCGLNIPFEHCHSPVVQMILGIGKFGEQRNSGMVLDLGEQIFAFFTEAEHSCIVNIIVCFKLIHAVLTDV